MTTRALHWFRRDLRVEDNAALHAACRRASDGVVGAFLICPSMWADHDDAPVKIDFWLRSLAELRASLERLNIPLLIRRVDDVGDIPDTLNDVANHASCDALYFNREHEVNEARRDRAVTRLFEKRGRTVHPADDRCILPAGEVVTRTGGFYTVFTPFQNRCLEILSEEGWEARGRPKKQPQNDVESDEVPESVEGFESEIDPRAWPAGEKAAAKRLRTFIEERASSYADQRDHPAIDATSALSPYLNAGVISPRTCLQAAVDADDGKIRLGKQYKGKPTSLGKWISELLWRDFYIHITHNFPRVSMGLAFKPIDREIPWRDDDAGFRRWCEGRTGYPFVDAAMRQLNETGWMHNRARMVVAMFLTKDLLIDWRRGERYFMRHLIDGDLASNNGGWQWSASTGTDAAPYFRVYNPTTQAERYDPEGKYIHRWVPELRDVTPKEVFEPDRLPGLLRSQLDYPERIVDHAKARERVLKAFSSSGG